MTAATQAWTWSDRQASGETRIRLLRPGWAITAMFAGYPLWWALGMGAFAPILLAVPMAASLAMRRSIRVPRGTGLWLLFLAWVLLTATQLDTVGRSIAFAFRFAQYVAAITVLLYAYNLDETAFPTRRGLRLLAGLWAVVVVGGWLALAAPEGQLPSFAGRLLPASLTSDPFVNQLLTPALAQVHTFLGFPLPRPAAPFVYTNTWGASFALLLPFALAVLFTTRSRGSRRLLGIIVTSALVPAVVSVNRAMWAAVLLGFGYMAVRTAAPRLRGRLRLIGAVGLALLLVASLTPVGGLVEQRLDAPHSNNARTEVATLTAQKVAESPLLGYGAPRPFEGEGIRPPLGTQGQLWMIVFPHGVPALLLFLSWLAVTYRNVGRAEAGLAGAVRAMLVALVVVLPFYELGGMPLTAVFLAFALGLRSADHGGSRAVPNGTAPIVASAPAVLARPPSGCA